MTREVNVWFDRFIFSYSMLRTLLMNNRHQMNTKKTVRFFLIYSLTHKNWQFFFRSLLLREVIRNTKADLTIEIFAEAEK